MDTAECTWDIAEWRKTVRWLAVNTLFWVLVAGVGVGLLWRFWLVWVIAAVLVLRKVALLWLLITWARTCR